jgi:hypothetical protein
MENKIAELEKSNKLLRLGLPHTTVNTEDTHETYVQPSGKCDERIRQLEDRVRHMEVQSLLTQMENRLDNKFNKIEQKIDHLTHTNKAPILPIPILHFVDDATVNRDKRSHQKQSREYGVSSHYVQPNRPYNPKYTIPQRRRYNQMGNTGNGPQQWREHSNAYHNETHTANNIGNTRGPATQTNDVRQEQRSPIQPHASRGLHADNGKEMINTTSSPPQPTRGMDADSDTESYRSHANNSGEENIPPPLRCDQSRNLVISSNNKHQQIKNAHQCHSAGNKEGCNSPHPTSESRRTVNKVPASSNDDPLRHHTKNSSYAGSSPRLQTERRNLKNTSNRSAETQTTRIAPAAKDFLGRGRTRDLPP